MVSRDLQKFSLYSNILRAKSPVITKIVAAFVRDPIQDGQRIGSQTKWLERASTTAKAVVTPEEGLFTLGQAEAKPRGRP